jgi:hypothetical protein
MVLPDAGRRTRMDPILLIDDSASVRDVLRVALPSA